MSELIKIAPNGQWTLEKSADKKADAERQKQIEQFMARKAQTSKPPAAPRNPYPEGLRPAQVSTMDHKGANNYTDPKVRTNIQQSVANREDLEGPQVVERKFDRGGQSTLPVKSSKPQAELEGPQEMSQDPKTNERKMVPRVGRFHGEGAVTTGKIVNRAVGYEDKSSGERRFRRVPQQEQHHWAWDANAKKWNHVRTAHINPTTTGGSAGKAPIVETVKRAAGTSAPQQRADWAAKQLKDDEG